jgi:hypothetical protein
MILLLRRYRLLLTVLIVTAVSLVVELSARKSSKPKDNSALPIVMLNLYPESAETFYTVGMQHIISGDHQKARYYFEKGIATGDRTNEDLLYAYALLLTRLPGTTQEIDDAIALWKFHFPTSRRTDPRVLE